ncbi:hypothetical protein [Halocatena pleomorpha]|uniref:Uncharacterized protein n=1 Tax=Halocatena pleomorpha TaxID=1785090 RepID=A0A3P3REQ8_9EURY|nr:hypothetical protein [Halocatena pleomorpha]RRJ32017.1 hypothetical protein EIK79_05675 [Halocatena pleomorpha]
MSTSTNQQIDQSNRETKNSKRIRLDGSTHRIIEIGRDSTSVFSDGTMYQLYLYHILVDSTNDFSRGFEAGPVDIDVGNGYRQFPVDRVLRVEEYPLLIEGRRTSITEWVVAVGERDLASQAKWKGLPKPIEQELSYRCRPSSYIDTRP